MADDFPADSSTTATLTLNTAFDAHAEQVLDSTSPDADWFAVSLTKGTKYRIDAESADGGDPHIFGLYDSEGTLLSGTSNYNGGIGLNARVWYVAPETGTYYLSAGVTRQNLPEFDYTVTVHSDWDDYAADRTTTAVLPADGSTISAELDESRDVDWLAFHLSEGISAELVVQGVTSTRRTGSTNYLTDVAIAGIYDSNGTLISGTSATNATHTTETVRFTATSTGTYYLAVKGEGTSPEGTYTASIRADDYPANRSTTGVLELNTPFDAQAESVKNGETPDADWFAVTLTEGTKYRIDARGTGDAHIFGLYDSDGNLISGTTNYSGGLGTNARVWYEASETGTYYVSAGAVQTNKPLFDYTITVYDDWDDYPADTTTTAVIPSDGSWFAAEMDETADVDWLAIELEAGQSTAVRLEGLLATTGGRTDVGIVGIYDSTGTLIEGTASLNEGTWREEAGVTATTAGTYYVAVKGEGTKPQGSYNVRLLPDELTANTETPGIVVGSGSTRSRSSDILKGGDIDWIKTPFQAATTYEVMVTGNGLSDPRLVGIYDADGTLIEGTTASGTGATALIAFTPTTGGTYFTAVAAETSDLSGSYTLQLSEDLAADTTTLGQIASYQTQTVLLTGEDVDWYAFSANNGSINRFTLGDTSARYTGIYDSTGTLIAEPTSGDALTLEFNPTSDGTYYVGVEATDSTASVQSSLRLESDDYGSTRETAYHLTFVDDVADIDGRIEKYEDQDWFTFDAVAGETYRIRTEGGYPSDLYYIRTEAFDPSNGRFYYGTSYGGSRETILDVVSTGTYAVKISSFYNWRHYSYGNYDLIVEKIDDDYAGSSATTGVLTAGETVTGVSDYDGDPDWFAVSLEAGKGYEVSLSPSEENGVSWYKKIDFVNADGMVVGNDFDYAYGGGTATLRYVSSIDQDVYVRVYTRNIGLDAKNYDVTLQELDAVTGTDADDWLTVQGITANLLATIRGGNGVDMMSFSGLANGITVDLHTDRIKSSGINLVMDSIENVTGTSHNDVFYGSDRSEKTRGLGGRDLFYGSDGERDTIDGGGSIDTINYSASSEAVKVSLLRGRGWGGDANGDRISNIENVVGSAHDDFIWGDRNQNRLEGGAGDDTLNGGGGNDYILAGAGTDVIVYSGNRADYTITQTGVRTDVVHNDGGWEGSDIIGHAEVLRFADGDVLVSDLLEI